MSPNRLAKNAPQMVGKIVVGALLAAVVLALLLGPTELWLRQTVEWIGGLGPVGGLIYGAIYVAATVLFVPGSILTVGAGFLFGVGWGTVLISVSSTTGALLAFFVGRYLARDAIRSRIEERPRFHAVMKAIEGDALKIVFLMRLVPLFPFNLLNYAFGLTNIPWKKYLVASWVGMLPGTIAYVYAGAAAGSLVEALTSEEPPDAATYAIWSVGAAALVLTFWLITRRARRELDLLLEDNEGAVEE